MRATCIFLLQACLCATAICSPASATRGGEDGNDQPNAELTEQLDPCADAPHPLACEDFPFSLSIRVAGKERKLQQRGNEMVLPLEKGEQFEIWVQNNTGRVVLMRLLVDGRNSVPEKETDEKRVDFWVAGKPVGLEAAKWWILDPNGHGRGAKAHTWAVRGFYRPQGGFLPFRIEEGTNSGIITAAFYEPNDERRQIDEEDLLIGRVPQYKPGRLLTLFQIYFEGDPEMPSQPPAP
jgi:hypothetical protein